MTAVPGEEMGEPSAEPDSPPAEPDSPPAEPDSPAAEPFGRNLHNIVRIPFQPPNEMICCKLQPAGFVLPGFYLLLFASVNEQ